MTARLPPHDGEPFLNRLEQSQREGDFAHVEANVGQVQWLMAGLDARIRRLVELRVRAGGLLERHQPPADRRWLGGP